MKCLCFILAFFLGVMTAFSETDVAISLRDSRLQIGSYANRGLWIQPKGFPTSISPSIVLGPPIITQTDVNGDVTLSNLQVGAYLVTIQAPPVRQNFAFAVTSTNLGMINAADNLAVETDSVYPPGSTAWSITSSDSKYGSSGGSATNIPDIRTNSFNAFAGSNTFNQVTASSLTAGTVTINFSNSVYSNPAITVNNSTNGTGIRLKPEGRIDLTSYDPLGAVAVLENYATPQTMPEQIGHYAFAAYDADTNVVTPGIFSAWWEDSRPTNMISQLRLQFMNNQTNGTQAATVVYIDGTTNGFMLPGIPLTSSSGTLTLQRGLAGESATILAETQIYSDDTEALPTQLKIGGAQSTDTTKGMTFGYNTTSLYGSVQAGWFGHVYSPLLLNQLGGNVGIGFASPTPLTNALMVNGTIGSTAMIINSTDTVYSDPAFKVNNSTNGVGAQIKPEGRIDLFSYDPQGGSTVIYNYCMPQTMPEQIGHFAFGSYDSSNSVVTPGIFSAWWNDSSPTNMNSELRLQFMKNQTNGTQPATVIHIDGSTNGFMLPSIPLTDSGGTLTFQHGLPGENVTALAEMQVYSDDAGVLPVQLKVEGSLLTDPTKGIVIGYNTTSLYGSIQAGWFGHVYSPLLLNQLGGNVGIGTNNPQAALHVVGNEIVSGTVTASNLTAGASTFTGQVMNTNATTGNYALYDASKELRTNAVTGSYFLGTNGSGNWFSGSQSVTISNGQGVFSGQLTTAGITNTALTPFRVKLTGVNDNEVSAAASGAVPINADGSATTGGQLTNLLTALNAGQLVGSFPGSMVTGPTTVTNGLAGLAGVGTVNHIAKFSSGNAIVNSSVIENSTFGSYLLGTGSPNILTNYGNVVEGNANAQSATTIGTGNSFQGHANAYSATTIGDGNVLLGLGSESPYGGTLSGILNIGSLIFGNGMNTVNSPSYGPSGGKLGVNTTNLVATFNVGGSVIASGSGTFTNGIVLPSTNAYINWKNIGLYSPPSSGAASSFLFSGTNILGTAEIFTMDGAGVVKQISEHAMDAPPSMLDDSDPFPNVDKEWNDYLGVVRWINRSREALVASGVIKLNANSYEAWLGIQAGANVALLANNNVWATNRVNWAQSAMGTNWYQTMKAFVIANAAQQEVTRTETYADYNTRLGLTPGMPGYLQTRTWTSVQDGIQAAYATGFTNSLVNYTNFMVNYGNDLVAYTNALAFYQTNVLTNTNAIAPIMPIMPISPTWTPPAVQPVPTWLQTRGVN